MIKRAEFLSRYLDLERHKQNIERQINARSVKHLNVDPENVCVSRSSFLATCRWLPVKEVFLALMRQKIWGGVTLSKRLIISSLQKKPFKNRTVVSGPFHVSLFWPLKAVKKRLSVSYVERKGNKITRVIAGQIQSTIPTTCKVAKASRTSKIKLSQLQLLQHSLQERCRLLTVLPPNPAVKGV